MIQKNSLRAAILLPFLLVSCVSSPPEQPDDICKIFKEKKSWYKAAMKTEKRWKLPPYVLTVSYTHLTLPTKRIV